MDEQRGRTVAQMARKRDSRPEAGGREVPVPSDIASEWSRLDDDTRERLEERAAIMEYDGGMDRARAECMAELAVLHGGGL